MEEVSWMSFIQKRKYFFMLSYTPVLIFALAQRQSGTLKASSAHLGTFHMFDLQG
jgi:hypothetical protein